MSDIMRPIPFGRLMDWILTENKENMEIFGIKRYYRAESAKTLEIFGEQPETPFGPAAGPHTQLAQNIVAGYVAGGRFFELKTVQVLDGEDLPVSKPCIAAADECYNVEWSTELCVQEAFEEYVKGWYALKLLSREFGFGDPNGFVFNMSVGYDLAGIRTKKIDDYIEGMKSAANTPVWQECKAWAKANISKFENIDEAYIDGISPYVARSITLSTLHGCPPDEIERIAAYLITQKNLNTFVKLNPTLLNYEYSRAVLDELGFDYIRFDDHHFKSDLQFIDAVPMLKRLMDLARERGLLFGVKLTNTFPVKIAANELPGEEMYMSGRPLFPLSVSVARLLAVAFGGKLRISYSGGADIYNIKEIIGAGVWPVTVATTLLKPGGYNRLKQIAETLAKDDCRPFTGVDAAALSKLADSLKTDPRYQKPVKPLPLRKMKSRVPLIDCFEAPCRDGCPIHQDIPAYLRLAGEGKHLEALKVITERNPLPFITGTICPHRCADKCTRAFYEESVHIRDVKLAAAQMGYGALMKNIETPISGKGNAAVVGGGPAGLSAAYLLAKAGFAVKVFEKRASLGGIVRHVIPEFRIGHDEIDKDIALIAAMGVKFELNSEIKNVDQLREKGFANVILATGAWKPGKLKLEYGESINVLEFLDAFKNRPETLKLGENVAVIGGGNSAMDAARAAVRADGVKKVSLVYRRTKRYMPADEEELALTVSDGVEFCELLAPVGVKNGKLTCRRMELGPPDASGRRSPAATDKTVDIPADAVISAVGELADTEFYANNGIITDEKGRAAVNPDTMETNLSGVYALGDARRGPATVVEAIADAISCAAAISKTHTERYAALNLNPDPSIADAKKGILFPDTSGVKESERCLECSTICECCADVCPNRANIVVSIGNRQQIVHIDYMCNECGNCETFCPYSSAPYKDKFTYFSRADDFENSENEGFMTLESGKIRVRLDGKTAEYALDSMIGLPDDIRELIGVFLNAHAYVL